MTGESVLYTYGIASSGEALPSLEGLVSIDGRASFREVREDRWTAVASEVPAAEFSQEEVDRHSTDLEWLGRLGVRHQRVNEHLSQSTDIIPLRAFTLFSSEEALRGWLQKHSDELERVHARTRGSLEWTLRFEVRGTDWMDETAELAGIRAEIESAPSGKAFLLQKKLEREAERVRDEAEERFIGEMERSISERFGVPAVIESRDTRGGADPQISVLMPRGRGEEFEEWVVRLAEDLRSKNVGVLLTGPWPPYSFAGGVHG
jgi:hypothetical protein